MFEAIIFICLWGHQNWNACDNFKDNKGPFKTLNECTKRVDEMKIDLDKNYHSARYLGYTCLPPRADKDK